MGSLIQYFEITAYIDLLAKTNTISVKKKGR